MRNTESPASSDSPLTYPALLHTLCHHDDVVHILFPHHLPEVVLGSRQWALGGDVLPPEVVALKANLGWGLIQQEQFLTLLLYGELGKIPRQSKNI